MIVAPLMTPILGTALALVLADSRRVVASALLVVAGAAAVVAIGYLLGLLIPGPIVAETNSQVAGRVAPKLIDLVSALATGAVGCLRPRALRRLRHPARGGDRDLARPTVGGGRTDAGVGCPRPGGGRAAAVRHERHRDHRHRYRGAGRLPRAHRGGRHRTEGRPAARSHDRRRRAARRRRHGAAGNRQLPGVPHPGDHHGGAAGGGTLGAGPVLDRRRRDGTAGRSAGGGRGAARQARTPRRCAARSTRRGWPTCPLACRWSSAARRSFPSPRRAEQADRQWRALRESPSEGHRPGRTRTAPRPPLHPRP